LKEEKKRGIEEGRERRRRKGGRGRGGEENTVEPRLYQLIGTEGS
jgi:hypothetical protein